MDINGLIQQQGFLFFLPYTVDTDGAGAAVMNAALALGSDRLKNRLRIGKTVLLLKFQK